MKHLKVSVTDKDIRDGIPSDPEHCALALAIKNLDPSAYVVVGRLIVTVNEQFYRLPFDAEQFVSDFDASEGWDAGAKDIPPQSFTLRPISDKFGYSLIKRGN